MATKRDLEHHTQVINAKIEQLRAEMARTQRNLALSMVTADAGLVGLALAAVRLA